MHCGSVYSMLSNAFGNVCFFDAVKCIKAMYVSSMLSNELWQCAFLRCCQIHYGNVRFFYAVRCIMALWVSFYAVLKCIMAMYVSSMLSTALWQCSFLLCCSMHYGIVCSFYTQYGNVFFFHAVKCIMAMYVSSMLSNALWQCTVCFF